MGQSHLADPVVVDFYLGLGSRYSYLAATQVSRIETEHHCRFHWKPIASGALMDRRGANPFRAVAVSGQYEWSYRQYDATCWAAYYGIPFNEPSGLPDDAALMALACLAADEQGAVIACCHRLFRMIFVDRMVIDEGNLCRLAIDLGLDVDAFAKALAAPETRRRHDMLLDEAKARGVFGVPTFFLREHMFWGNDRLVLLEAALRGLRMPSRTLR
jgi:2-hydroxychromene-2-carboxylate isomerase